MNNHSKKPIVLSISGHDPTGGAGIQADTEVFNHYHCHPCSILTCLTVQDSRTVHRLISLNADNIIEQANVLFADMPIAAIKIGLTGSIDCVEAIETVLLQHPNIPVIFDPVLASGNGTALADDQLISAIKNKLIPLTTVITPNTLEAYKLTGLPITSSIESLGFSLLELGPSYALITGGHIAGEHINNRLFHKNKLIASHQWPRRPGEFHGTGCTLASAITALIAKNTDILSAVTQAQEYTNHCIQHAEQLGRGQRFPCRIK
ncbi:MAG: hydroxymethylpyrimidine/phosphomethylpyrimidine kinase [Cycloclasticus sp. symbiont of Bathymodiolus heckerae]|nr:MAG: hydroxymethylpyrimidine/phosphomethylpyrimidine kinase [Cycloclasticus sp. symbiont of Bathymodiolus heckerae]